MIHQLCKRLAGVFLRMGFRQAYRFEAEAGEWAPIFVRNAR